MYGDPGALSAHLDVLVLVRAPLVLFPFVTMGMKTPHGKKWIGKVGHGAITHKSC